MKENIQREKILLKIYFLIINNYVLETRGLAAKPCAEADLAFGMEVSLASFWNPA
jgi:hypothetical protein